jgi:hypothetical protein
VSVGDHHPEDTQDDGRQHIALRHPAYAATHINWADSMEGNAVANPCQATEPAEKAPRIDPTVVCSAEADVELTAGGSNFTLRSRDGNVCASGHARRSGLLWFGRSSGCHVVRSIPSAARPVQTICPFRTVCTTRVPLPRHQKLFLPPFVPQTFWKPIARFSAAIITMMRFQGRVLECAATGIQGSKPRGFGTPSMLPVCHKTALR